MHGLLACVLVVAGFFLMLTVVRRISLALGLGAETRRKAVHMGTGIVSLSFPWLFPSGLWFLVCMGCMLVALLAIRLPSQRRRGAVLHGVQRQSLGDLWFLVSVAVLYFLSSGEPALYVIPLAVMSFSDALAAMIGTRHGRHAYPTHDGMKSWEGTAACLVSAFIVTLSLLLALAGLALLPALLIALNLAVAAALVEGISWRGLDNLLLPLAVHILLAWFPGLQLTESSVVTGLASLAILGLLTSMAAATIWRGLMRADAAMAAVLFAYIFWAAGGTPVLAAMVIWFAHYAALVRVTGGPSIGKVDGRLVAMLCAPASLWAILVMNDLAPDNFSFLSAAILVPPTAAVTAGFLNRWRAGNAS